MINRLPVAPPSDFLRRGGLQANTGKRVLPLVDSSGTLEVLQEILAFVENQACTSEEILEVLSVSLFVFVHCFALAVGLAFVLALLRSFHG